MRKTAIIIISLSALGFGKALPQSDSISLKEVEVKALYNNHGIKSSTPVQIISAERMQKLGIGSMAEALRHISGITVRDYGGAGGMKTVSVRGIGARHTAVVYDGMAVSDCQTGEIDLSRFDTENMRSMSLIIGDADDIFVPARNVQPAATIKISTLSDSIFLRTKITTGSWGTVSPSIRGAAKTENAIINFSTAYTHSDNNYPFRLRNVSLVTKERRHNSRMDAGRFEAAARWKPAAATTVEGKAYYYDNNRQLPGIVHLYTHDNNERLHEQNAFAQALVRTAINPSLLWKASSKSAWASAKYKIGEANGSVTNQNYWQREYYASTALLFSPVGNISADYSADLAHNNLNTTLPTWDHPNRNTLWQSVALKYASTRLTAVAKLLSVDCWDDSGNESIKNKHTHRFCPSASISCHLLPSHIMARASWKSTFRMPSFNELYFYHIGTTDLKPERTSQWNIGFVAEENMKTCIGRLNATISADAYIADVDDKIVAIPFNMFIWRMMNLAKVRTTGIDVNADFSLELRNRHSLALSANYTLQKAQNRSNPASANYKNQIVYTPENTFAATLMWQNPWADIAFTIDGMDERWTTNEHSKGTRIDGFAEMDINIRKALILGKNKITLSAAVLNITDKQYDIVAHYPMPGRSWRIGAEFEL